MKPEFTASFLLPEWPAPSNVRAVCTTRIGGISKPPYDSLNLADHVGDNLADVEANRKRVCEMLALDQQPVWLKQVHGTGVVNAATAKQHAEADAVFSDEKNKPCAVMTADCLPVLMTNLQGTKVAAAHAGWRGLAAGVIEKTIDALEEDAANLLLWFGPAIGPEAFEVGVDVYDKFVSQSDDCKSAFRQVSESHYLADIYELARVRLLQKGVSRFYGGGLCTYSDAEKFYSYRRDNITGRMASMIWISSSE